MSVLSIDFESRSTIPLNKTGVYPYAQHETTDIWCMAYAFDDEPVGLWTPDSEGSFARIWKHITRGGEVRAWNAQFERVMWHYIMHHRYGFPQMMRAQIYDTAADAAALALPRGLGKAAVVLGLPIEKDDKGYRLMMQMAKPRKPRKNEDPDALIWWDDEERRERLYAYCKQDVEVERAILARLRKLSPDERRVYLLDQEMNDRGVLLDMPLVRASQVIVAEGMKRANKELDAVTDGGVSSVTKIKDLTRWLQHRGLDVDNVRKDTLRDLLEGDGLPEDVRRALEIRRDSGKTSTAKLTSMEHAACPDDRARGLLLYHGASTGRWSGKLVQPQNFPRPTVKCDPACARVLDKEAGCDCGGIERFIRDVMAGRYDDIDAGYPPIVVVSSLLRSMLRAAPDHRFMAGDFAQIEARVLAWIAGQDDLVADFAAGAKIYEEMAAFIYGVPVEEIENPSERRQIGKGAILGGGFQMGGDRFAEQVQQQTGIVLDRGFRGVLDKKGNPVRTEPDQAADAIGAYRTKNHRIRDFWPEINAAAMRAVLDPGSVHTVGRNDCIRYVVRGQFLWCQLPSGRFLAYSLPDIREKAVPWGGTKATLSYMGVNSLTNQWVRHYTYGGHLTENVVQAMARDLIAGATLRLNDAGYRPILTVHDEVIYETPEGHGT
ncbi:MAG: DNA polymerase, partial [Dehalococcoidia bacterium]